MLYRITSTTLILGMIFITALLSTPASLSYSKSAGWVILILLIMIILITWSLLKRQRLLRKLLSSNNDYFFVVKGLEKAALPPNDPGHAMSHLQSIIMYMLKNGCGDNKWLEIVAEVNNISLKFIAYANRGDEFKKLSDLYRQARELYGEYQEEIESLRRLGVFK